MNLLKANPGPGIRIQVTIPLAGDEVGEARIDAPGHPDAAYVEFFHARDYPLIMQAINKITHNLLAKEG